MFKNLSAKRFLLLLCMLLSISFCYAQERIPEQVYFFSDSLKQKSTERQLPETFISSFQQDSDFNYSYGFQSSSSLWDQILVWVLQKLKFLFGEVNINFPIDWLLYIFCAFMIIFAVLKLSGVSISGLFQRKTKAAQIEIDNLSEQNIHDINFEAEISEATQKQDFRLAIRLLYIYTLKKLSDQDVINWHPGKTNADYQSEINADSLSSEFRSLSIYYEYAWYGEFPVDATLYQKVQQLHQQIEQHLGVSV
ncbi:DUF4129 domain-containing protein [Porifericola rhodea]|uniref:DUF4129 domain-containing protein n=1 Tax=Porifericola rhodea TaxID=930972 RepID=UPI0026653A86|nr:DUF4129 domain-containing protein [Porifericola rhodea]WKN33148.1 DUF4129 domain-containing protein [Porifericola rhodea]